LVDKALTSGGGIAPGTKMPSNFAASGAGSNYKIAGLPTLGKFTPSGVSSGKSPTNYSTTKSTTTKTSVKKAEKGLLTPVVNVYVDGNKQTTNAIKVGTTKGKP